MNKKYKKVLIPAALILVLGVGGYFINKKLSSSKTTTSTTRYSFSKVKKENLSVTVEATGSVSGADAVNVFSANTGTIGGMTAKLGQAVNKGELFCKIDDTATQQSVDNARISLERSYLELEALKNQLDDLTITAPIDGKIEAIYVGVGDTISSVKSTYGGMAMITVGEGNSYETAVPFPSSGKVAEVCTSVGQSVKKGDLLFKLDAKTINNSIAQKENDIKQAEKNLQDKEQDLAQSTITTPISGIVTVLNVKNGEIATNEKLIATITDTSKLEVTLPVDELDINNVQIGQNAAIKFADIADKTFTGKVESISQSGTTSNNVTTYNVVVAIDNPDGIKLGMNANVSIAVKSKENVLCVPVEAIIEKNGKKYVMVQKSGQNAQSGQQSTSANKKTQYNMSAGQLVEVQTGIKNKSMIEILSGVSENQVIMTQLPSSTTNNRTSTNRNLQGGMTGAMGGRPD